MDNIAGPPVEGENFFGREAELASLLETLRDHDVLLLGPRRIGKTSIARAVMQALAAQGWQVIEINVASCSDEQAFVEKLAKAAEAKAQSWAAQALAAISGGLADLLGRVKAIRLPVPGAGSIGVDLNAATGEDWSDVASATLRLMSQSQNRWLIYIDELPIFLYSIIGSDIAGGVQRVRRFLDWFRNDVRALPECRQLRWLVTGSVGLDTLVQRHRMADTINSLKHESLPPYSHTQATEMLRKLTVRYELAFAEEEIEAFVQAVGWPQPYYLQLVFNHLRGLVAQEQRAVGGLIAESIRRAAEPGNDNDYHHWEQRLFTQLGSTDANHAVALLSSAAQAATGARPEALLAALQQRMPGETEDDQKQKFVELRDILQRDAYWWPDETGGGRRYRFRLELLRFWWLRRHTL